MNLEVIYEDNHIIVVNKKAGEITQGDRTGDRTLPDKIKDWLKEKYNKPGNVFLGVIHRLDRPTSGIVVFAKTSKALSRMNRLFQTQDVKKIYWAIVEKEPRQKKEQLIDFLLKNPTQNKSYVVPEERKGAKKAILNYELIAQSDRYFLLEIELLTGRHHQIRTQLANINCILKGDLKYGARTSNSDGSISLHARSIEFIHPVSKEQISLQAKVPDDKLWHYFENK